MSRDTGIWPAVSDARLLYVLESQVTGALEDLHVCTEDGLGHLEQALDKHPKSGVSPHIIRGLTDLQKIDRVTQRLRNVAESLAEWAGDTHKKIDDRPMWADAVADRFVMPEESAVLKQVLEDK